MPKYDVTINDEFAYNSIDAPDSGTAAAKAGQLYRVEVNGKPIHQVDVAKVANIVLVPCDLLRRLLDGHNAVADVPLSEEELKQLHQIAWPSK
jgi:hypothetical protein